MTLAGRAAICAIDILLAGVFADTQHSVVVSLRIKLPDGHCCGDYYQLHQWSNPTDRRGINRTNRGSNSARMILVASTLGGDFRLEVKASYDISRNQGRSG